MYLSSIFFRCCFFPVYHRRQTVGIYRRYTLRIVISKRVPLNDGLDFLHGQFCCIKLIELFLFQHRKPAFHPCIIPRFIFSRAILAAENKPSVVHIKLFTRLLNSDVVRQLQRLGFEILIVPFHCLSSSLFRQFWHCTFMISLQCAHHPYRTYPEYLKKRLPVGSLFCI